MDTGARNQPRQPKGVPVGGQWKAMARPVGNVTLSEPTADEWAAAGFASTEDAKAWQDAVFLPEEAAEWQARSFGAEEARRWRHCLFSATEALPWRDSRFGPEEAFAWEQEKFTCEEAVAWRDASFGPDEAREWEDASFTPAEAAGWHGAGFEPSEASEWAKVGGKLLGVGDMGPVPKAALVTLAGEMIWVSHGQTGVQCLDPEGRLHSVADMASVRSASGYRAWHRHGAPDRPTGPARAWPDGRREYWERGRRLASYAPAGWQAPPAGSDWRLAGHTWAHTECPCAQGRPVPAQVSQGPSGDEATCPACGDQVLVDQP